MRVPKVKTLNVNKAATKKRFGKTTDSIASKNAQLLEREKTKRYNKKQEEKTKRYVAKQERKKKDVMATKIARNSALGAGSISSSTSAAVSSSENSKAQAEIAKYQALMNGNIYGVNGVDPTKDGGQGNVNPDNLPNNNAYEGLF